MQDPKWWDKTPTEAWGTARSTVMATWDKLVVAEARLEGAVAEGAVAFGREARTAYADLGDWSDVVESRLSADWREAGREAGTAWVSVRNAIRHGWDSASVPQLTSEGTGAKGVPEDAVLAEVAADSELYTSRGAGAVRRHDSNPA